MTDTPSHIYEIQLKIWLDKSPEERLFQFLKDNEAMYLFCNAVRNLNQIQVDLESNKSNTDELKTKEE